VYLLPIIWLLLISLQARQQPATSRVRAPEPAAQSA